MKMCFQKIPDKVGLTVKPLPKNCFRPIISAPEKIDSRGFESICYSVHDIIFIYRGVAGKRQSRGLQHTS